MKLSKEALQRERRYFEMLAGLSAQIRTGASDRRSKLVDRSRRLTVALSLRYP